MYRGVQPGKSFGSLAAHVKSFGVIGALQTGAFLGDAAGLP